MNKLLILLLLSASFLAAQGMPPKHGDMERGGSPWEKLGLDKSKQDAMEKLHSSKKIERQKIMLEMEKKEIELKEILLTSMDIVKIKKNCDERGAVWSRLQVLEFETDVKVKELLNQEQWEKYISFKIQMRDGRFEPGAHKRMPPPGRE